MAIGIGGSWDEDYELIMSFTYRDYRDFLCSLDENQLRKEIKKNNKKLENVQKFYIKTYLPNSYICGTWSPIGPVKK